jgi:hypothetical protein
MKSRNYYELYEKEVLLRDSTNKVIRKKNGSKKEHKKKTIKKAKRETQIYALHE